MTSDAPHEVTTARFAGRVTVTAGGETVADSKAAVVVHETGYGPTFYLPVSDVRHEVLEPSDHTTRCPHKGKARYWNVHAGGRVIENAAWAYDTPFDSVAEIAGLVAFYPDKVDAIEAAGL